jgi:hypothetical protein
MGVNKELDFLLTLQNISHDVYPIFCVIEKSQNPYALSHILQFILKVKVAGLWSLIF